MLFFSPPLTLLSCRESVSLPLILDVGSSTLWEIDKCIEYTGVHGVAVSGIDLKCLPLILSYKLCELKYFIINLVVFVLLLTSIFQRLQIRKANFSYRRHLKVNLLELPLDFLRYRTFNKFKKLKCFNF